nr:CxxH/CxxC protein [Exiguobacterium sp. SL14]
MWISERRKQPVDKYVCLEHVELALDEIVDETEQYPILDQLNPEKNITCEYCEAPKQHILCQAKNKYQHVDLWITLWITPEFSVRKREKRCKLPLLRSES